MKSLAPTSWWPRPTARGLLDDELERLALEREPRVAQVGQRDCRRRRRRSWRLVADAGGAARAGGASVRPVVPHVRACSTSTPTMPGELAGERLDLGLVADRRDEPGRLADGVDPAVRAVEVVLGDDVAEHEAVERHAGARPARARRRHPAGCRRSHGSRPSARSRRRSGTRSSGRRRRRAARPSGRPRRRRR